MLARNRRCAGVGRLLGLLAGLAAIAFVTVLKVTTRNAGIQQAPLHDREVPTDRHPGGKLASSQVIGVSSPTQAHPVSIVMLHIAVAALPDI